MKRLITSSDEIMCMSNIRGMHVVTEPDGLDFSFFFSRKMGQHGIRVKVLFDPTKVREELAGVLQLHGSWKFTPGPEDSKVSSKRISRMKKFFQDNKVLFSAVWETMLPDDAVIRYFWGMYDIQDVVKELECYSQYEEVLNSIHSVSELEKAVREHNMFNMND